MKLHILDLPDSQAGLAAWLEMHLTTGDSLNALVAELTAVSGPVEAPASLQDVLSPADRAVMESGLSAASLECLQQLLRQPDLLLDLQERVLLEAHPYWESRIRESTSQDTDAGWDALQKSMSSVSAPVDPDPGIPYRTARTAPADRPASRSGLRGLSLLVACVLLIGLGTFFFRPAPQQLASGWGFQHSDAMQADLPADQYLQQLARSAGQWSGKRPVTRELVRERMTQFIAGCDTLLSAAHTPLSVSDRDWLVEHCRECRDGLTDQVAQLDQGADPLDIRAAADDTIRTLIQELETRATEITA